MELKTPQMSIETSLNRTAWIDNTSYDGSLPHNDNVRYFAGIHCFDWGIPHLSNAYFS